jgi:hypothetical protein
VTNGGPVRERFEPDFQKVQGNGVYGPVKTNYGPQRLGMHTEEAPPETGGVENKIVEGERLCQTCGLAAVCAVRVAITVVAPEGGIEVGACGLYWPVDESAVDEITAPRTLEADADDTA